MPLVRVIRKGVTPSIRKVPTSTCAAVMPVTLDQVGKEAVSEDQELTRVEDVNDAFGKFRPELKFTGFAGPDEAEFRAEFRFKSVKDFDPENMQKKQEIRGEDGQVTYLRNDIADLKKNIDLLYRLKDRWKLPTVRRAWANETQRGEIIDALSQLRAELEKVATRGDSR
jgi:type VI secretion system protein ImpB